MSASSGRGPGGEVTSGHNVSASGLRGLHIGQGHVSKSSLVH